MVSQPKYPTLLQLADELKSGKTDAVMLTEAALTRAQKHQGIFIIMLADDVRAAAHASKARRDAGKPLSRFDGIPIAWKDLFDVAGTRTTAGSRTRADIAPAQQDAVVVDATRRAGLIPLGKTNLTEFAFSALGLNPSHGTPSPDFPGAPRVPGGSSSGSAVAVQRGIVAAAIGTDTAGSVRVPAAFNGLVGYKSSTARYDMSGVFPLSRTFDSLGPIAQTVSDCVWMDALMRGLTQPKAALPFMPPQIVFDPVLLTAPGIDNAVRDNFLTVMHSLEARGARVTQRRCDAFVRASQTIAELGWLGAAEGFAFHRETLTGAGRSLIDARVVKRLEAAGSMTTDTMRRIAEIRAALVPLLARDLNGALLAMPAVQFTAPELAPLESDADAFARINLAALALTMPLSFLDAPGIAMPSGTDAHGLPTSVMFSAPSGQDDALLSAALWIENEKRW